MSSANVAQRIAVGVTEVVDASGNTILVVDGPNRTVQVPSGTAVQVAGTTLSTTELGLLDGVTAGTGTAGKVVVLGTAKGFTNTMTAPTTSVDGFTFSFIGASATPGTCRAVVGSATTYTSMTSGNLVGARGSVTMGGACSSTAYLYGVQGKAITGANAFSGTVLAGVYGQIDVSNGTISSGHVAAIQANIYGANTGSIPMEGIYVEHAGGGVINSLIQCFGKSDYVFDLASNTHTQMGTTGGATTAAGWLKCNIEGVTRYINLFSTAP